MSEFTYTYSRSVDFGGQLAAGQFATEVSGSSIGTNFLRVDTLGDDVYVIFSVALSGPEQTTLDGLVAAHVPLPTNVITSTNGYIELNSSLADAQAVQIKASNAAGGIYINAGTGGIDIDTTNGLSIDTGAAISITNTAGNITLDTPALIDLNAQSGINIGNDADAVPINIGTGAAARTITVGNSTGATAIVLTAGSGNITATTGGALTLDAGGVLELNSTGGSISLGNDADNQNINIATAGSRVVTIGNTGASSAVNIVSGTWGLTVGNDASSGEIQIAASANAKTVRVGNTTGGSRIFQKWGSGGHIMYQPAPTSLADGNATLTIAQILGELFVMTPSTARTLTLPTAADAVAGVSGVSIDDCVDFRIINLGNAANDPEIVIAMGTGGTAVGNMEVYPPINNAATYNYSGTGIFRMRFTNVTVSTEAYTIYRIG